MITVPLSTADVQYMRFAYSPLAEVAESLYMIASGRVGPLHRPWFAAVREQIHRLDLCLLNAIVPAKPFIADFLFAGATDTATRIEDQLQLVVEMPADLGGGGMTLVPSVFTWPRVIFAVGNPGPCSLTYTARGVGNLWNALGPAEERDDPLVALLGRARAAILVRLALPMSTTELARKLEMRPPAVSQHLTILRRSGLATSWRSGHRVLYRRSALADSILATNSASPAARHA